MGMACGMQVKRVHVAGDERFMVDEHRRGASRSQNLEESDRTGPSGEGRRAQKEWRWLVVLPGFFFFICSVQPLLPFRLNAPHAFTARSKWEDSAAWETPISVSWHAGRRDSCQRRHSLSPSDNGQEIVASCLLTTSACCSSCLLRSVCPQHSESVVGDGECEWRLPSPGCGCGLDLINGCKRANQTCISTIGTHLVCGG
jgi:hypothetical protein